MKTTEKIQKITSKGQITLPIAWRKLADTNMIIIRTKNDTLEIAPFRTEDDRDDAWVTLFDAVCDNGGKGIPAKKLAQMICAIDQKP